MRKLYYFFATFLFVLAIAFALWQISQSRTYQVFGEIVPRVETSEKVVALTFDDGPTPQQTSEILEILAEENVNLPSMQQDATTELEQILFAKKKVIG